VAHGFFQTLWTQRTLSQMTPSAILTKLNEVVLNSAQRALGATMFVATFDQHTRKMTWGSAGHPPPLMARFDNGAPRFNFVASPPSSSLGAQDDATFVAGELDLNAGDLAVFYTDGLTEAENPQGAAFGSRRLIGALRESAHDTVEAVRQKVIDAVKKFAAETPFKDDLTYLVMKVR
jgi:sigma-B regulation protein RsbU (phosphoserine phosphatase)